LLLFAFLCLAQRIGAKGPSWNHRSRSSHEYFTQGPSLPLGMTELTLATTSAGHAVVLILRAELLE
jgi:hypothetical protein